MDPDFQAYKTILVDSFEEFGTDTSSNRFLQFLVNKNNVNYNLTQEKAQLVNNILVNNESATRSPAKNFWLYDPRSYNGPLYKIKALAFLWKPESSKYGNKKDIPSLRDKILNSTDEVEIENLIDAWGKNKKDNTSYRSTGYRRKTSRDNLQQVEIKTAIEALKELGRSQEDATNLVKDIYQRGDKAEDLILKVLRADKGT